ncbi:MAG TPA: alpha/beta fold hydrolase [Dehalococcoidia bacterium]|nr:alpha/beta fold hydrolase [Dehalococcoidia bacterium]
MPVATVNDIDLHYRDDGDGQPVLFIQGLGVDHRGWAPVTAPLAKGFRCISFDNRDVGRSSQTPAPYDVLDMAADALALLDALAIPRADIVGVSMGGVIAQEIAIRHPHRVRRLALLSTYTSGDPRGRAIFEGQALLRCTLGREEYCRATFWSVYTHADYQRPGFIDEMVRRTAANDLWQPQDAYERHVRAVLTADTESRLRDIAAPTLILAGAEDILTPMRFQATLARDIPDNRLHLIEHAGHGMIWSHPEEVLAPLTPFLAAPATP